MHPVLRSISRASNTASVYRATPHRFIFSKQRCPRRGTFMAAAFHTVQPEEAKAAVENGATYLDVRTEQEYVQGHVAGSINIPYMLATSEGLTVNANFSEEVSKQIPDKDTQLVVACKVGGRSSMACNVLDGSLGFTNVSNMAGGFDAWRAKNLPSESN